MIANVVGRYDSSSYSNPTALVITLTDAVPTGNAVIVPTMTYPYAVSSVVDSKGNTYALDTSSTATLPYIYVYSALNVVALAAGDTVTITCANPNSFLAAAVLSVPNIVTVSAKDKTAAATGSGTTPVTATTAATTQAAEYILALEASYGPSDSTPVAATDTNYTTITSVASVVSAYDMRLTLQEKAVTSIGAQSATFSGPGSNQYTHVVVVTYKSTASATGGGQRTLVGIG